MAEGECKNVRRSVMDTQLLRTSYSTLFSTSPQTGLYDETSVTEVKSEFVFFRLIKYLTT